MADHINFPYRSAGHLPFLHVVSESGAWEKQGLDVNYNYQISSTDSHLKLPTEEVEFIGGNHVSTYGHRAKGRDTWVYLGQTINASTVKLIVRPDSDIVGVSDLRGKVVGCRGGHATLNDWLYLKQRGIDWDAGDCEMVNQTKIVKGQMDALPGEDAKRVPKWHWVADGRADACFEGPPQSVLAARAGLRVIDIDPLPMIMFTTVSSSSTFIKKHPDIVNRFLKGLLEGSIYFKTHPEESVAIIKKMYLREGELDDELAEAIYQDIAHNLAPKLYPTMDAVANVYQEALYQDKESARVAPLELWDLHHLRQIDDSGFINELYGLKNN